MWEWGVGCGEWELKLKFFISHPPLPTPHPPEKICQSPFINF
jgi:hypothetical protein